MATKEPFRYYGNRQRYLQRIMHTGASIYQSDTTDVSSHTNKLQKVIVSRMDLSRLLVNYPGVVPYEHTSREMISNELYTGCVNGITIRDIPCMSMKNNLRGFTMVLSIKDEVAVDILLAMAWYSLTVGDLTTGECNIEIDEMKFRVYLYDDPDAEKFLRIVFADPGGRYPWDRECFPPFSLQTKRLYELKQ